MTSRNPLERWKNERRALRDAPDFVDQVMGKVRAVSREKARPRSVVSVGRRVVAVLAVAACASLILACQTAVVGAIVLAMPAIAH